jgi:hypothetical protein
LKDEQISNLANNYREQRKGGEIDKLLKFKEANRQIRAYEFTVLLGLSSIITMAVNALFGNNIFTQKIENTALLWVIIGFFVFGFIGYLIVIIYKLCSVGTF